jgi:hypothetical protein
MSKIKLLKYLGAREKYLLLTIIFNFIFRNCRK